MFLIRPLLQRRTLTEVPGRRSWERDVLVRRRPARLGPADRALVHWRSVIMIHSAGNS